MGFPWRALVVAVVAFGAGGSRTRKRIGDGLETNSTTNTTVSNAIFPNSVLLSVADVDPETLLIGAIEGIAEFDFSGNVGEQSAALALATFGTALSMANPILGVVFSVASGLLGLGGANENDQMILKIREMVTLMIKEAISTWVNKLQKTFISGIMNEIKKEKTWADWQTIGDELSLRAPMIFNSSCWDPYTPGPTCTKYRQEFGGGAALVTELEYAELMISSYISMKDIGHPEARDLRVDLKKAAELLYGHLNDWISYRLQSSMFRRGILEERGCGYGVRQGQDAFVHNTGADRKDRDLNPPGGGEFTGPHCDATAYSHRRRAYYPPKSCFKYQEYGRRRSTQDRFNSDLDECLTDWRDGKVKPQLNLLKRRVNAAMRASYNIIGSEEGSYRLVAPKKSNGRCGSGYTPSESQCLSAAMSAMHGLQPTRSLQVGNWYWVPLGCSVQSGGDWAVHFNRAAGSNYEDTYSSVCARR